ncbi:hypothetical protein [[Mycobacterium] burgundiense]|uniref:Transposase n=1 Tax=[Mycobacterium] burgundiense TaxID=3064286 RepID=A0ABM9LVX6_9MYCO|nr:hypothetical protein [Mycolicibacterium sp. MU0053]CAJ1505648.1 hypothetical protein MU0053_002992 [Mycolicibacterium sp. MU0053]
MTTTEYPVDSTTRTCCGGIGRHTRDCSLRINGIRRRISTILDMAPASSWSAEEAEAVWEALAGIVAKRQSGTSQT